MRESRSQFDGPISTINRVRASRTATLAHLQGDLASAEPALTAAPPRPRSIQAPVARRPQDRHRRSPPARADSKLEPAHLPVGSATYLDECRYVARRHDRPRSMPYRPLARETATARVPRSISTASCAPILPICDPIVNGIVVKKDAQHITAAYSKTLTGPIETLLTKDGILLVRVAAPIDQVLGDRGSRRGDVNTCAIAAAPIERRRPAPRAQPRPRPRKVGDADPGHARTPPARAPTRAITATFTDQPGRRAGRTRARDRRAGERPVRAHPPHNCDRGVGNGDPDEQEGAAHSGRAEVAPGCNDEQHAREARCRAGSCPRRRDTRAPAARSTRGSRPPRPRARARASRPRR